MSEKVLQFPQSKLSRQIELSGQLRDMLANDTAVDSAVETRPKDAANMGMMSVSTAPVSPKEKL